MEISTPRYSCMCVLVCMLLQVEATIYSLTDIFSDRRLQKSECGNNNARSSEQQDMQTLGLFSIPKTIAVRGG